MPKLYFYSANFSFNLIIAIFCTLQEALNKIEATRSSEPITKFFETLLYLSTLILAAHLSSGKLSPFFEHCSGADGDEI